MRRAKTLFANVTSSLGLMASHAPFLGIAILTAIVCGLVLAQSGFGDDNEAAAKTKPAANSDSEPKAASPPSRAEKDARSATDDSVRHHGALGVLLGQSEEGVSVVGMIPGSPAERAGLRLGDEIRYVDDQRIVTTQQLIDTIGACKPGSQVDLLIRRSGKRQIVGVALATRESTFSSQDREQKNASHRSTGRADRGRVPDAYPSAPNKGALRVPPQVVDQRIRLLEQRLYRLQQEINDLKASQRVAGRSAPFDVDQWWERSHHGEADDDPDLFQ